MTLCDCYFVSSFGQTGQGAHYKKILDLLDEETIFGARSGTGVHSPSLKILNVVSNHYFPFLPHVLFGKLSVYRFDMHTIVTYYKIKKD